MKTNSTDLQRLLITAVAVAIANFVVSARLRFAIIFIFNEK